jgi:hypothetical protein
MREHRCCRSALYESGTHTHSHTLAAGWFADAGVEGSSSFVPVPQHTSYQACASEEDALSDSLCDPGALATDGGGGDITRYVSRVT